VTRPRKKKVELQCECYLTRGTRNRGSQVLEMREPETVRMIAVVFMGSRTSGNRHFLGFLPYRTGIALAFRRNAIIVGPRTVFLQMLSLAAAMEQHQPHLALQNTIRIPQMTGTPISMQQMKRPPSVLKAHSTPSAA
jgi:hypothetical protein